MKKVILKVFGVAALAAGMMYNMQVFDSESSSGISLAALENVAFAQGGENNGRNDHAPDPVNCTYVVWECTVDILGYEACVQWTKGGTKIDCTYWKGANCTPTACS